MEKIVIYIKSYRKDFELAQGLLNSIKNFNADDIPVYISVNDPDYKFFRKHLQGKFTLLPDREIVVSKMLDGWRYQAIIRSQFHRLNVTENYLCVDSDSFFIRPFYRSDFLYDDHTPYTIMHEHKDFMDMLEIIGMDSSTIFHIEALKAMRALLGTHGKFWDYGPSPHLWSTSVWKHFNEVYLNNLNHDFESFYREMELTALPHEAVMYGEYLLKTRLIDILPIEGFFKVYHYKEQWDLEKSYYDLERLKKNYMGIIMQSNWSRPPEEVKRKWFGLFK